MYVRRKAHQQDRAHLFKTGQHLETRSEFAGFNMLMALMDTILANYARFDVAKLVNRNGRSLEDVAARGDAFRLRRSNVRKPTAVAKGS